jgi:serine/threonine-protein kinase
MPAPKTKTFEGYRLIQRIATSGIAQLFKAQKLDNAGAGQMVALKVFNPQLTGEKASREAFLQQIRLAAHLNHPHQALILDWGEANPPQAGGSPTQSHDKSACYLVREWIAGRNLAQVLARAKKQGRMMSSQALLGIFFQAARALDSIPYQPDSKGEPVDLIHGHVCPQNLLISFSGAVKLTDLGLYPALDASPSGGTKRDWAPYLAPEQARGQTGGHSSDLYCLGVMLWEGLTGWSFQEYGASAKDKGARHITPPSSINPQLPVQLDRLLIKALDPEPRRRFQDALELCQALAEVLDGSAAQELEAKLKGQMHQLFGHEAGAGENQDALAPPGSEPPPERASSSSSSRLLTKEEVAALVTPEAKPPPGRKKFFKLAGAAAALAAAALMLVFGYLYPGEAGFKKQVQQARAAIEQGSFNLALAELDRMEVDHPQLAVRLDRVRAEALLGRATSKLEGDTESALQDLSRAAELAPDWPQVYMQAGRVLTRLERFDEALATYGHALRLDPQIDGAWFNTGYIHLQQGRNLEAVAAFRKVVDLNSPYTCDAYVNMAVGQARMGNRDQAVHLLRLALVKNPNHKLAQANLKKLEKLQSQP